MQLAPKGGAADAATRLGWPPDFNPDRPPSFIFR